MILFYILSNPRALIFPNSNARYCFLQEYSLLEVSKPSDEAGSERPGLTSLGITRTGRPLGWRRGRLASEFDHAV